MAEYVITYFGGNPPASAEEGGENMNEYRQWMASLGDSAVSPADPLKNTQTISADGSASKGSATEMSGSLSLKLLHGRGNGNCSSLPVFENGRLSGGG